MNPNLPIESLSGIGKFYSLKLKKLGIETVEDFICHFPFRYEDFSNIQTIREIIPGEKLSIVGTVWGIKNIRTRNGKFLTLATVADPSGVIEVIWFNQPFLTKNITAGTPISLSGRIQMNGSRTQLVSPSYEILKPDTTNQVPGTTLHTGRLVPMYPETEGLTSKWIRAKIANILPLYLKNLKDFLPEEIIKRQKFETLQDALKKIHLPENFEDVEKARERLAFDELFLIQLTSALQKKEWQSKKSAPVLKIKSKKVKNLIESLPFTLTDAQKKSLREITSDLQKPTPANRLLEGDVGSGKTVVAAIAAYISYLNGFDTILAAPTEILAFQHQKTLKQILEKQKVTVGIWTGSKKNKGSITCGTHALLTSFTPKNPIGLVIVDEQHRFGVAQRAKLFQNQSQTLTPHLLTMTATPIPRTLALTIYQDLDLSVLNEMPKGRQKIATFVVPQRKRRDAYKFIERQIKQGRQAFILTPFVEPSESMVTVKAATEEFEKLTKVFSNFRHPELVSGSKKKTSRPVKLGLLHGRLKSKEKEKIIEDFKKNKINILVTTPVVEVGIDIPNATVMMIESAERFGLAQLHQLRGRVGRGEHKSYCLLFTQSQAESSIKRLKSMEKVHVGFELAEIDLKMRGAGEIFGLKQSGFVDLKIASLWDTELIKKTQEEVSRLLENGSLKKFPLLMEKIKSAANEYVQPN